MRLGRTLSYRQPSFSLFLGPRPRPEEWVLLAEWALPSRRRKVDVLCKTFPGLAEARTEMNSAWERYATSGDGVERHDVAAGRFDRLFDIAIDADGR